MHIDSSGDVAYVLTLKSTGKGAKKRRAEALYDEAAETEDEDEDDD